MLSHKASRQAAKLREQLLSQGWAVHNVERPFEDEWWSAEVWHIESVWRPHGVRACLTFLVDPMGESDQVWAVYASSERPQQRPSDEDVLLNLGHGWHDAIPVFVRDLERLRSCKQ